MTSDDMRPIRPTEWLHRISSDVSKQTGLKFNEIHSYRRYAECVRARKEIIRRASAEGLTGAEIARAMAMDKSQVRGVLK